MKTRRPILAVGLLIAIAILAGWLFVTSWQRAAHPLVLRQFANADRVVMSQLGAPPIITITGASARDIVRVITAAKPLLKPKGMPMTFGILLLIEVKFYQDTKYLGKIDTSSGLLTTDYSDGYEADHDRMESLVDGPFWKAAPKATDEIR